MHNWGTPSFSKQYLDDVRWTEFKRRYLNSVTIPTADELELYLEFKRLTGRTVVSMERKLKGV